VMSEWLRARKHFGCMGSLTARNKNKHKVDKIFSPLGLAFRAGLLLILAIVPICCKPHSPDEKTVEDIREAVFRYQFGRKADCYCISVEKEQNPSKELMQRFINYSPQVRMSSECKIAPNEDFARFRDVSGKTIIFHTVRSVKLKMWKRAEAEGSWELGPLHGEAHRYFLKYENGAWKVTGQQLLTVS